MTSANLSLVNRFKMHRTYVGRTLWVSLVALPVFAVYFILGVIMMISRAVNYASMYHQTAQQLHIEKLGAVSRIAGFNQIGWVFVIFTAVLFGLQGFSYVFNVSQMDFYLSQPTTRAQRIKKNYVNAITTFIAIYVSTEFVALIIAAALGGVNSNVLISALIETVRSVVLFFTFYNITVLSVMLSGSLPFAVLLTFCFSAVSVIISGEIELFNGIFFSTYYSDANFNVYLSPLYDRIASQAAVERLWTSAECLLKSDYILKVLKTIFTRELDIIFVGLISFCAVLMVSKFRKVEWAGQNIPIRPLRWLIKTMACIVMGIGSGYVVYLIYVSVWNKRLYTMMLFVMVLVTIVTGCIAEVILEGNIKRMFKGMAQTVMALAVVVLVFVIYRGDLLGYDSFVPAADKVESCAILNTNMGFNYYDGFSNKDLIKSEDYMTITNVQDFIDIARVGMKTRKESALLEQNGRYTDAGYNLSILYRMKNGRKIYRYITVPYDVVDDKLENIISSEEYKIGNFEVFHDDEIREADKNAVNRTLRYVSCGETKSTTYFDYTELSEAYRRDILLNYSFKNMKNVMPTGSIEYEVSDETYVYGSLNVYDTYTNTINLLKAYGIYTDSAELSDNITEVIVTNYYPGYDLEKTSSDEIEESVDSKMVSYYDKESVKKILEAAVSTDFYNMWYNYNNNNSQYSIQVYTNGNVQNYGGAYYTFIKGKVPDFVEEDTNK